MKISIILNGVSRKKKKFYREIYPGFAKHFSVEILETERSGQAEELAAQAVKQKTAVLLAAGGDGTLHQVVNGVMKTGLEDLPPIGLIPLGSGNDFARSCSLQPEAEQIFRLLNAGQPKPTDIGKITCADNSGKEIIRYFINACSIGMGPEVVKRMEKSSRALGPDISYLKSIFSTFISHQPQEVSCKASSWEWKGKARVVAITNGKSFGSAIYIAPDARLDDGVFNSFIAGDVPLWKFLFLLQSLKGAKKLKDDKIIYNVTRCVELTAPNPCPIEAEGELIGWLPARVEILPGRLRFFR